MTNKIIVLSAIMMIAIGCGGRQSWRPTTPDGSAREDTGRVTISTEEYRELQQHSSERDQLIDSQITDEQRREAEARIRAELEPQIRSEARTEARRRTAETVPEPAPSPARTETARESSRPTVDELIERERDIPERDVGPGRAEPVSPRSAPAPQYLAGFGPPGMTAETQAFAGGSAPWQRYGGQTGGQEIIVRVNSAYAIALAIDGQMVQPISGGMPLSVPAYAGGGITQVPVIPATRSGGWSGSHTTSEYRILADSVGRRQLTWRCFSVASGRAGRPAGSGGRTIDVRPGTRVLITDSMCR